jgi:hypothetical protein
MIYELSWKGFLRLILTLLFDERLPLLARRHPNYQADSYEKPP